MSGELFPDRDRILFVTFSVILVTLVGQGLLLPTVIRALGLAHAGRRERHADRIEEFSARRQAIEAANQRLDELAAQRDVSEEIIQALRTHHRERLKAVERRNDSDPKQTRLVDLNDELQFLLIAAERQQINELYKLGKLKDEARRRIERELDLREAQLISVRAAE